MLTNHLSLPTAAILVALFVCFLSDIFIRSPFIMNDDDSCNYYFLLTTTQCCFLPLALTSLFHRKVFVYFLFCSYFVEKILIHRVFFFVFNFFLPFYFILSVSLPWLMFPSYLMQYALHCTHNMTLSFVFVMWANPTEQNCRVQGGT